MRVLAVGGILTLSLSFVPTLPAAAESLSKAGQLLLWVMSLPPQETAERRKIDVNSATVQALTTVPGLDRRQAVRIIAGRPYAELHDLVRVGLAPRLIERLAAWLTVGADVPAAIRREVPSPRR